MRSIMPRCIAPFIHFFNSPLRFTVLSLLPPFAASSSHIFFSRCFLSSLSFICAIISAILSGVVVGRMSCRIWGKLWRLALMIGAIESCTAALMGTRLSFRLQDF